MVLDYLSGDIDSILERITESHLKRYDRLQRSLLSTDVASNGVYQSTFNGYYRMQRRQQDWYGYFFSLLEREKRNRTVVFRDILDEVHQTKHRVEPSFSSKLVATIRPEMPVYDRYVRENLCLEIPGQSEPTDVRVRKFVGVYSILEARMTELVQNGAFPQLKKAFDDKFPCYAHFTDVKKLDLLLWQYRQG